MSLRPEQTNVVNFASQPAAPQIVTGALKNFFLRAKLLPPRTPPDLLLRPRLFKRLRENLNKPATLVTANAGSGKTTLVADFLRGAHGGRFVWYQLDSTDADPSVFLSYLTHGVRQLVPEFGDATLAYLQQFGSELAQCPQQAVDVFLNEVLEKIEEKIIIALDDYHHLGAETSVHAAVDRMLAYMPDTLHLIIISRDAPPLAIARHRSRQSLAVIDRNDLLFTDEETGELFRTTFNLELTPAQLEEYRERTHGWITALQLIRQVALRENFNGVRAPTNEKSNGHAPNLSEALRQSEREIFDYFAEEVLESETEETRQLLSRLALLERVEANVCAELYPDLRCETLLPQLVRRNVFITLAGDVESGEEYRFHPMFRSFLRRRLRAEIGQKRWREEHARIADFFFARSRWEQAAQHLLAAEEFERAARFVAEMGGEWIAGGALSSLVALVEAIPTESLERHPRSLSHRAEAARLRGEYAAAESLFRRAVELLRTQSDGEGEAEALHSLATLARRRGDFKTAFDYLNRAIELTDEDSAVRVKCGNTRGLCLAALGEWAQAESEFRAALKAAEARDDVYHARLIAHNLGIPSMMRGDFREALSSFDRMLSRPSSDARRRKAIPQEATAHLNMARCHVYRGEFERCEKHLEQALDFCQRFNLVASLSEIFETYGNLYRERGDAARALESYERAERAYSDAGVELARTELFEERALVGLLTGDLAEARAQLDAFAQMREASGNIGGLNTARLARGRVALAQKDYQAARQDIAGALQFFRERELFYYEAQACLALAACDEAARDEDDLKAHVRHALELSARFDYAHLLEREIVKHTQMFAVVLDELPALLRERIAAALKASEGQTHATEETKKTDEATKKDARVLSHGAVALSHETVAPLPDLTMNLFGAVEIFRDPARPFSPDAWTTKRARDIFCFIATRPHRRASKDLIVDTFWGAADYDTIEKNFYPTISHIRKALNSNQLLKRNFVLYRDGEYRLNPDLTYHIDAEEFERLAARGEKLLRDEAQRAAGVELCERAVALYRGEFMAGGYDDWAIELRDYYRQQFLQLLDALIASAQTVNDWAESLRLARRSLQEDCFRERTHVALMRAHAALGNKVAAKEQYETLRRTLRDELGVEPSAEAQKTYREIMS